MSATKEHQSSASQSEIAKFYDGKSVLITGAAGYLGMVLLEILLRLCPGIHHIFIVLRAKKGLEPEGRKKELFQKELFFSIRDNNPEYLEKVIVITGDIAQPNLGMKDEDLERVRNEVTIVFQCAASISFLKSLRYMLEQNFLSVNILIDFCRSLKKLDALVYTSTAYSNSNNINPIDEKVYKMQFTTTQMLETLKTGSDEDLLKLYDQCEPKYVNYYTFSKCLGENLIEDKASDLPVSIIRPSIIASIWKGIVPGYVEGASGLVGISVGVGKGFIRVLRVDPDKRIDYVPCDMVANAHIIAVWLQATERLPSPVVYNCVLGNTVVLKWGEFVKEMMRMAEKHPIPNAYQKPSMIVCKNAVLYWMYALFEHYLPAIIIDLLLKVTGRKPKLYNLYKFYDKAITATRPFILNDWGFRNENYKSLDAKLNAKDLEMFPVSLNGYNHKILVETIPVGAPTYKWEADKKSYKERQSTAFKHYCFTSFIKWSAVGCLAYLFFLCFTFLKL